MTKIILAIRGLIVYERHQRIMEHCFEWYPKSGKTTLVKRLIAER